MKKAMSVVLAVLMLCTVFTSCSNSTSSTNSPSPSAIETTITPSTESQNQVDLSLPIVTDGSVTLEYWRPVATEVTTITADYSDNINYVWTELTKRTGINFTFIMPTYVTATEQFNLMISSGDYPDICFTAGMPYPGGADKAVEDGVWMRLNELAEKYAPNYMSLVNADEIFVKNNLTDAGNMVYFCGINDRIAPPIGGYAIKQNWLDDLGLEKPVTYDDWSKVLIAFKENKTGGNAPMDLSATGLPQMNWFTGGYGVSTGIDGYAIQKDGVVSSSIISDGYRKYLETMHGWYASGLIDPDFISRTGYCAGGMGPEESRLANDESGVVALMYTFAGTFLADTGQAKPGSIFSLCPLPRTNTNEQPKVTSQQYNTVMGGGAGTVIFASSKYAVEATRLIDYLYSSEGALLANYGIEGVTFNYDAGKPKLTDLITKNKDVPNTTVAQQVYLIHDGSLLTMMDRKEQGLSEYALEYSTLWGVIGDWNIRGSLSYTAEEGERKASLSNEIKTYVEEFNCKVITGQQELTNDSWNSFVTQVKSMGIDELISIIQSAYSRYQAR